MGHARSLGWLINRDRDAGGAKNIPPLNYFVFLSFSLSLHLYRSIKSIVRKGERKEVNNYRQIIDNKLISLYSIILHFY